MTVGLVYNLVQKLSKEINGSEAWRYSGKTESGGPWISTYLITILAVLSFLINFCIACGARCKGILGFHVVLLLITLAVDVVTMVITAWDADFHIDKELENFSVYHLFLPKYVDDFFPCLVQAVWMLMSLLFLYMCPDAKEKQSQV